MATSSDRTQNAIPAIGGPPQALCIQFNPCENWKLFNQKWQNYSVITNLERQDTNYQVALLLHTLGDEALKVYNGFNFHGDDRHRTVDEIIAKFDEFVLVGAVNETYERFLFNRREQKEGESFENFQSAIRTLAKTCNYCDNCKESLLRDRIVIGVRDSSIQTTLLKERHPTLGSCVAICKSAENAITQGHLLRPETVHRVVANRPKHRANQAESKTLGTDRERKFCGRMHQMKKGHSSAWGKTCTSCKQKNHFAVKCPKKPFTATKPKWVKQLTTN